MSMKAENLIRAQYLARGFLVILGCSAVWWGIVVFPRFWQESSIERIAGHIIAGEQYKTELLARQLPSTDRIKGAAYCRPAAIRSAAIFELRLFEVASSAIDKKPSKVDFKALDEVIRSSLSCSPADPFLWLVLYRLETAQNGANPKYLKYLKMSYELGPNEAWIALKRSGVALADFERLPSDLQKAALNEFVDLLRFGFYESAATIFVGPGWHVRHLIVPQLNRVPERSRQEFAKVLYRKGVDIIIPGTVRPGSKPLH
jgi:hypothetical protein